MALQAIPLTDVPWPYEKVPIYRPTMAKFRNFWDCVNDLKHMGGGAAGIGAIVPPKEWKPVAKTYVKALAAERVRKIFHP